MSPTSRRPCQTPRALESWLLAACLVSTTLSCPSCTAPSVPVAQQAALLSGKGRDLEAIALLDAHLQKEPSALAERRLLVRLLAAAGQAARLSQELGQLAARLPPDSPLPWLELGHALELSHRYDEALAQYDRAAEVAPLDPSGPREGGLRSARWGEAALAAPRLEEALRRDPRDAEVWHALGVIRLELGDLAGAEAAYESGLVADPTALENRLGLATLALKRKDAARALSHYDRLLAARPAYADGYLGRSFALIALGRWDEAARALADARERGADPRALVRQERLLVERRAAARQREGEPYGAPRGRTRRTPPPKGGAEPESPGNP